MRDRLLAELKFPPHARGWTDVLTAPLKGVLVSPARAGMDLPIHRP